MNTKIYSTDQGIYETLDLAGWQRPENAEVHVRWIATSYKKVPGASLSPGVAAYSLIVGGPPTIIRTMTKNSETVLGVGVRDILAEIDRENAEDEHPTVVCIAPHEMKAYRGLMSEWRRHNDWDHADGEEWHELDIMLALVDGYLIGPPDDAHQAEVERLHRIAYREAQKLG